MNILKSFNKITYYLLLIIVGSLTAIILGEESVTLNGLAVGSVLYVSTITIASIEGYKGAGIAIPLNLMGLLMSLKIYNDNGNFAHIVIAYFQLGNAISCGIISYLSESQMRNTKRLEMLGKYDYLTNVLSHSYFNRYYQDIIDQNNEKNISFVIIDIDNFKGTNEKYGYKQGDEVLKAAVRRIQSKMTTDSSIFRISGDQFLVSFKDKSIKEIEQLSNDVKEQFMISNFKLPESMETISIGVSIGISNYPSTSKEISNLLEDTYKALSYVKNSGHDNVKVYENVFSELENLILDDHDLELAIKTILLTINSKDNYTNGHSIRVSEYSYKIGTLMRLDQSDLTRLKLSGLLHDLGKINVESSILNKTERLTDEEYDKIKNHVVIDKELSKYIPNISEHENAIRFHHERYDGLGYPEGLKGLNIPIDARIIAVADAYDAMLSNRPYRSALKKDKIIEELSFNSGKQFDPDITRMFIDSLISGEFDEVESRIELGNIGLV